ncbi:MAG: ribosome biogenesis GTP-binding protein YihA/YsxC [Pseudomonadota bacterium]
MNATGSPSLPLANFLTSAAEVRGFPHDSGREVVFAGRSNCGKSTAINAITNRRGLARTSKTPGRTQLINFFDLQDLGRLADLPGYGFAQVPPKVKAQWAQLMESYFAQRRSLVGMMLIMDARRPLGPFDRQMLAFAQAHKPEIHVLLSKADKLNRNESTRTLTSVRRELGEGVGVQLFSGLRRVGVDEARQVTRRWLEGDSADLANSIQARRST